MARRRNRRDDERPGPAGFLVVDKPQGWTSHDVVDAARGWLGTRRVGHLGTLVPLATGVLPLAIRQATKLVPFLEGGRKGYRGSIRLGEETNTLDAEGVILRSYDGPFTSEDEVLKAMQAFVGEIEQIPPMFSAVKRDGVPLHRLAREGREVERPPKLVSIHRLELVKYTAPIVQIEVDCSAGTYVRALASDLGARLGCGAHLDPTGSCPGPHRGPEASEAQKHAAECEDHTGDGIDSRRALPSTTPRTCARRFRRLGVSEPHGIGDRRDDLGPCLATDSQRGDRSRRAAPYDALTQAYLRDVELARGKVRQVGVRAAWAPRRGAHAERLHPRPAG